MEPTVTNAIWMTIGAFFTLAIFSFLYKDNPFYKIAEHVVVGVSAGYWFVLLYRTTQMPLLNEPLWKLWTSIWHPDVNLEPPLTVMDALSPIPLVMGLIMFTRLIPKIAWLSRWSIAYYLGISSGVVIPLNMKGQVWEQMRATWLPVGFNSLALFNNIVIIVGVIAALAYFFFSKEHKGWFGGLARVGIWILMLGFGATFGYTVMSRISLLIGRVVYMLDWWGVIKQVAF